MRGARIIFALAALFIFATGQPAQAQTTVSYFGFDFPLRIGPLTRGDVTNFEKEHPGLGYGIRYSGEGLRVDIFVYNLRKRSISWDVFHADQKDELANAIADVHRAKERGLYRSVKEGQEFESPAVKNPFFRCKAFTIDRGEGRIEDSALCLGAQNNTYVKVRIGMQPPGPNIPDRADKLLRQIASGMKF
jgi:hypothetical protein